MSQLLLWISLAEIISSVAVIQMLQGSGRKPGDFGLDPVGFLKGASDAEVADMKLKEITHCRLAMLAFSGAASAEGPYWTYIDAGIKFLDSGDDQTTGGVLEGSLGLGVFHANLEYQLIKDAELGDFFDDTADDFDQYRIGIGVHPAVSDTTDAVVELGYNIGSFDDFDADPDFWDLRLGVRSMLFDDKLELNAFTVLAMGDSDSELGDFTNTTILLGGQYFFTDSISLSVEATDDFTQIGGRFSF